MNDESDVEREQPEIQSIVQQIKTAIVDAEDELAERKVLIQKVDLEINSVLKESPGGKFEFDWGPIKLGGGTSLSNNQITKIKITISPQESELELMAPKVQEGLSAAIDQVLRVVDDATSNGPAFDFESGAIELSFGVSKDAEIKVMGLGTSASETETHKIVLHLEPSP